LNVHDCEFKPHYSSFDVIGAAGGRGSGRGNPTSSKSTSPQLSNMPPTPPELAASAASAGSTPFSNVFLYRAYPKT
jgi:hypothetical protein